MLSSSDAIVAERTFLCELLAGLDDDGWHQPSLCEGWTVEDVAAHLVARERDLLSSPGIVIPALAGMHQRAMQRERDGGHAQLLARLRALPRLMARVPANLGEFWIHNEDILRGGLDRGRPAPDPGLADLLWRIAARNSTLNLARVPVHGIIAFVDTDNGEAFARKVGAKIVRAAEPDDAGVIVRGGAGEILLYVSGRRDAADVTISGHDETLAAALATAKLGI